MASSRERLETGRPDAWDSGRRTGDAQLALAYEGRALRTGQQVFWRVRAWDSAGEPSPWSGVATWTMGVTRSGDWQARWITDPELLPFIRTRLGFSTPPVTDASTPQWVELDLGREYPIDRLVLYAVEYLGLPRWFKVEVASDPSFVGARTIVDHTRDGLNVTSKRLELPLAAPARYLRLTASRLAMMEEEDQPTRVGRLALAQIEVISGGRNVAVGAKVTASASEEDRLWSAAAMVDGLEIPGSDPRAGGTLLVRHEFPVHRALRRALLFVTGLGSYTVSVNGTPVGAGDLLKPGWTDVARRCFYDTRDITALLRPGPNAVGLTLANGMYNVPAIPGRYGKFISVWRPLMGIAQVRLEYEDGTSETLGTDGTWKVAPGPTVFAHMYGGEDYDARREPRGWDRDGFDDAGWRAATVVDGPGGTLQGVSEAAPPVRAAATLPTLAVRPLRAGVAVYDLGQNAALMPRLQVRGAAGSRVKISPAEVVNPDGSIDPTSCRPPHLDASWNYTLAGTGAVETWAPQFFYHGARYLQVECTAPDGQPLPVVERLDGVVVHSDSAPVGEFSCSNELFNRIATLIRWAQLSNLASVITDCPHRERLGWLEQYHLNGPSLRANFDLTRLYAKGLADMADAQRPNGLVPDIAPEFVRFQAGFRDSPEWGSAVILAAWQQYLWTGDDVSLRRGYAAMQRYFAYLGTKAANHLLTHGLGDWYDLGPGRPGVAQLTPIALTATAIYYEDARALQRIATKLGRAGDAGRYRVAAAEIAAAFNAAFFDAARQTYATGSQVSNAMPLVLGLVPAAQTGAVVAHLVDDIRAHQDGLTAGDVGYRYLLRALAEAGRSDVVFAINDQSDKPGYGYQLKLGATSLTEAWDAARHSSQNHFMLGQITEWFYQDLAGLAPDPAAPGFARTIVRPNPVGDVTWARARYRSVRGEIEVSWRRENGRFRLNLTVPANARARVELPAAPDAVITEGGLPVRRAAGVTAVGTVGGRPAFETGAGRYAFECALP